MTLGAFSLSLSVKDLAASCAFYEALGFSIVGGNADQGWQILRSPSCTIGLFEDMFEGNLLTFNPGWDDQARPLDSFTDIRDLQKALKSRGIALTSEANEETRGPASFTLCDPDGNVVLVDQHV